MPKFTDHQLMGHCASKQIHAFAISEIYNRLFTKPIKDMNFVELRCIELLNSEGVGVSKLIKLHTEMVEGV